jgi:hypothetical protein
MAKDQKRPVQFSIGVLLAIITWTAISLSFGLSLGANGVLTCVLTFWLFLIVGNLCHAKSIMGVSIMKISLVDIIVGLALYGIIKASECGPAGGTPVIGYTAAFFSIAYVGSYYFGHTLE